MSYILEALKKAQAERQLGDVPTIHAPAPTYATPAAGGGKARYLAVGLGAGVLLVGAVLLWRWQAGAPALQVAATPAVPAPASPAPPAAQAGLVKPTSPPARTEPGTVKPVPAAPPAAAPEPIPEPVREAVREPVRAPAAAAARPVEPQPRPAAGDIAAARPAPAASPASGDDYLPTLQQLPEALQREIPRVSVGGHIYSPTPGESLLLIDKALRREGEQVAPGLVLERLGPKSAVMNYRGTRYRVGY